MADRHLSEKRVFSYEQAVRLLPEVRRRTEEAQREIEALGPVPTGEAAREEFELRAGEIVSGWAQALIEMGLEVKGLWLVDFDNGSGYYCWKYPEPGLLFFHGYSDGFAGRIAIQ